MRSEGEIREAFEMFSGFRAIVHNQSITIKIVDTKSSEPAGELFAEVEVTDTDSDEPGDWGQFMSDEAILWVSNLSPKEFSVIISTLRWVLGGEWGN